MADNTLTAVGALATNAKRCHEGVFTDQADLLNTTASVLVNNDNGSLTASVVVLAIPVQSGTTILAIQQTMSLSASAQAINFGMSGVSTAHFGSLTGQAAAGFLTSKNLPYKLSLSDDAADPRVGWITLAGFAGSGGPFTVTAYLTRDPS